MLKEFILSFSFLALATTAIPVLAEETTLPDSSYIGITEEEIEEISREGFEWADTAPIVLDKGKSSSLDRMSPSGSWSWRDGVICVSDSKTFGFEHGHAGIVSASWAYATTEAINDAEGVGIQYDAWFVRDPNSRCYQCG